jgi:hypothetical protein
LSHKQGVSYTNLVSRLILNLKLDYYYIQQPQGYHVKGKENLVSRLKKRLYGLKQVPRKWYLKFDRVITEQGYSRCHYDHYDYFKRLDNDNYIILLFVCK